MTLSSRLRNAALAAALVSGWAMPAGAQELGPVTNLPLPRFVSLKTDDSNVRRGPSLTHRIDWVYTRKDLPLEITAEYGNWRRVRDRDGAGGWMHYSLLSGSRTVLVDVDETQMRADPAMDAQVVAKAERGVIARLGECLPDWCRIRTGGYRGWVPKTDIWGVTADEVHD
ncbi:MAG: SH3 domain-containing protein [Tranquillimonas sp.]